MNGATTEPSAKIIRAPKMSMISITGASQSFLRTFKNSHNSKIKPTCLYLKTAA